MVEEFDHCPAKEGDLCIHCGHLRFDRDMYWVQNDSGEPIEMYCEATGDEVAVQWMIACDECYEQADNDIEQVAFVEVIRWLGTTPMPSTLN